jgi:hypothetical protein
MKAVPAGSLVATTLLVLFVSLSHPPQAGEFENAVRTQWRGAWVILDTEVYSSCNGGYHVNKVSGSLVTHRGGHRFLPGEVGKVQRVQLKKKKVELMIALELPVRFSRQDGPFTLYDYRKCSVSLEIQVPRELTRSKDISAIDRIAAGIVQRFETREAAVDHDGWNEREAEPLPADYDMTLARHAVWKAEQTNLAVDEKRHVALEQIKRTGKTIDDDTEYLAGLAAGIDQMRRWQEQDCRRLMAREFGAVQKAVPEERKSETPADEQWRHGYADGQRLLYNIELLERLETCYVPVPGEAGADGPDLTSSSLSRRNRLP